MYKVVAIIGKAGSGKDSLLRNVLKLTDNSFHKIVTNTTRPPREKEKQGIDYNFLTEEEYFKKKKNNEILESAEYRGWYYSTSYDNLDENKINIGVFGPYSLLNIINNQNIDIFPIYVECSNKERLMRQLKREKEPDVDEIIRRYGTDKNDFQYLFANLPKDLQVGFINNDFGVDLQKSAQNILNGIKEWTETN